MYNASGLCVGEMHGKGGMEGVDETRRKRLQFSSPLVEGRGPITKNSYYVGRLKEHSRRPVSPRVYESLASHSVVLEKNSGEGSGIETEFHVHTSCDFFPKSAGKTEQWGRLSKRLCCALRAPLTVRILDARWRWLPSNLRSTVFAGTVHSLTRFNFTYARV